MVDKAAAEIWNRHKGLKLTTKIVPGLASRIIVDTAKRCIIDLIMLGSPSLNDVMAKRTQPEGEWWTRGKPERGKGNWQGEESRQALAPLLMQ